MAGVLPGILTGLFIIFVRLGRIPQKVSVRRAF